MAILPEEIVQQTPNNTTHFYPSFEEENNQDTIKNDRYRFPGLMHPRKIETVASDIFFPTDKASNGHSRLQLFMGIVSDRWSVYPSEKESKNGTALQYY